MDNTPERIPQPINIGGIKLSHELVQFIYTRPSAIQSILPRTIHTIAARQINISYFSLSMGEETVNASFCVEVENHVSVEEIITKSIPDSHSLTTIPSVGALTLFPHRNSFNLLGKVVQCFVKHRLPVYGLCTSISALSVLTDYKLLENGILALETIVQLPENHAPFRQEFNIRQVSV